MFNLVCKPDEALASYMASEGIDWKFLTPRAPNFGGLWEAGVKSLKFYLKRVVGNIRLTYEEFLTVIIQIEGMLNSRPLVPLSSDLDDLNVLTPSHFLIGSSITSIVEPDLTNLNENRLDNWQKITKIIQLIWKRWSVDYLNSLQQRNKWHFEKKNAKIGDMVIIKEDNLPSCQWSLGRINNIYQGKDSKVRVVEVKITRGLPSEAEEENCDLIVLDDMMNDVTSEISQMFTMGSHHKKYSIILITQNLFPRVKSMRDISLNAHYIILFRNNRDVSQAACFGRQAFPGRGKFFMDSYKKATEEPFSYLLVDVHPRSPEVQRLPAASPAQRKAILKSATDDQIKTLCEICDNLLSGNIPTKKIKKLCSYKRVIRLLANRSVPISRKRKLFTTNRQVGGFLPLILPGVLSLLGGIAGKAIGKRI
ncbi:integrase catalytic domain-containing protein [Trichonephila clavipes]|nr:integrase catalytic domain-containing protein [Trichonephila clavipes]